MTDSVQINGNGRRGGFTLSPAWIGVGCSVILWALTVGKFIERANVVEEKVKVSSEDIDKLQASVGVNATGILQLVARISQVERDFTGSAQDRGVIHGRLDNEHDTSLKNANDIQNLLKEDGRVDGLQKRIDDLNNKQNDLSVRLAFLERMLSPNERNR
jgi:hypothetical protein